MHACAYVYACVCACVIVCAQEALPVSVLTPRVVKVCFCGFGRASLAQGLGGGLVEHDSMGDSHTPW